MLVDYPDAQLRCFPGNDTWSCFQRHRKPALAGAAIQNNERYASGPGYLRGVYARTRRKRDSGYSQCRPCPRATPKGMQNSSNSLCANGQANMNMTGRQTLMVPLAICFLNRHARASQSSARFLDQALGLRSPNH